MAKSTRAPQIKVVTSKRATPKAAAAVAQSRKTKVGKKAVVSSPVSGVQPAGKIATLITMLRRPKGASIEELMKSAGWQAHSVRGAISGGIKKKLSLKVLSERLDGVRVYRIIDGSAG